MSQSEKLVLLADINQQLRELQEQLVSHDISAADLSAVKIHLSDILNE